MHIRGFRVIIAGSRTVESYDLVEMAVNASPFKDRKITEIVSGGALGADFYGEQWAQKHMIPIRRFPADWRKYRQSAGPIRNEQMAQYADALIAVWDGSSRGTKDMINKARLYHLEVFVYNYGEKAVQETWL